MGYFKSSALDGKRGDLRFPVDFRAIAHWGNRFAVVRVTDIADSGMRLAGECLPNEGQAMRIGARGLDESAIVAWRNENECGIALSRRIDTMRIVRANCRPGTSKLAQDRPLGAIMRYELASRLVETFQDEESAIAFMRTKAGP
jgi:hypothetical protein